METVMRPHRAQELRERGNLSLVVALCFLPLGALVWYQATVDLAAMDAGKMDPAGREATRSARVFGIVATAMCTWPLIARALLMR